MAETAGPPPYKDFQALAAVKSKSASDRRINIVVIINVNKQECQVVNKVLVQVLFMRYLGSRVESVSAMTMSMTKTQTKCFRDPS